MPPRQAGHGPGRPPTRWAGQPVGALLSGSLAELLPIRLVFAAMAVGVAAGATLAGWSCLRSGPLSVV
ncbi:MAG: hypothetical protein ACM3ML_30105, partial [Micromonosporaceae bacterium]